MPDPKDLIQREIDAIRSEVSELEAKILRAKERLPGLEYALSVLGAVSAPQIYRAVREEHRANINPIKSGRKVGAIANSWKGVYGALIGRAFSPQEVEDIVFLQQGRRIRTSDAKRVVETHIEHGYVERDGEKYRVTDFAVKKFNLSAASDADEVKENEPPEGGSEAGEVTASPDLAHAPGFSPLPPQAADPAPHSGGEGGD